MLNAGKSNQRLEGVRVERATELDPNTPGIDRAAALTYARAGAEKLWAGTVVIEPTAKTEAGPDDFIYVPPCVPHQDIKASDDLALSCVVVRSDQGAVVINLDVSNVEPKPQEGWGDDIHR